MAITESLITESPAPALAPTPSVDGGARRPSVAALVFLRGRDADARLRELVAGRLALRPVLGKLADAFLSRRLYHAIGYRCLGDWAREKLGMGDRVVREWARVHRELAELPRLRAAVEAGEVPWSVARKVVKLATPETDAAVLESVRGRTLRAVEAMLRAVREAEGKAPQDPEVEEAEGDGDRVAVRLHEDGRTVGMWNAACELARRMAGEEIPTWACADEIAAEGSSVFGADEDPELPPLGEPRRGPIGDHEDEDGRREVAFSRLRWKPQPARAPREISALGEGLDDPSLSPLAIAKRLEAAVAFRQALDHEIGRLLRQVVDRKLHRELGFSSFARFVEERLACGFPARPREAMRSQRGSHPQPAGLSGRWRPVDEESMRVLIAIASAGLGLGCFVGDELDRGDELMKQLGPGKGAAKSEPAPAEPASRPASTSSASSGPGVLERVGRWWNEATEPEPPPPGPGDALVHCHIGGSSRFMRASDCELRGGRASPAGD